MTNVQFGWAMPSGMREKAHRPQHLDVINRGLDMVKGTFDSAWFVDHIEFDDVDVLEGWTAVSYLAATHPDFMFGHAVLCQSFRNPALLAKMGATIQFMSGGRFILGLGAGWKEDEYEAYGYDFPPAGVRVDQLDEYVQIIKAMWRDEQATFEGKHYRVKEAWCEPKPDPIPPIMIGAMKPKMIALTVRHADWWNVSWTKLEDFRRMVDDCERACEEQGRDPKTLRRTWFGGCACAPTQQALDDMLGDRGFPGGGIKGTPDQVIEQMRGFIDLGVDYFMLGTAGLPNFTTMEMLLDRVVPAIKGK
jgi:alkanesulfonate monooxygenase SsuD/methylene tetrahydromethanopterin reductase-like flavin-dependent oxidoreductase (luciferase family)